MIEATIKDKRTAIAVVHTYKLIVLSVTLPRLCTLLSDEIRETREKNTKGTISIFKRFIKIEPPRLKT